MSHPRPAPTGWAPHSPCQPGRCLPAATNARQAAMPRRIGRLLAALLLILSGFVFSPLLVVLSRRRRLAAVRIGARLLLHSLGIALTIRGRLARPGGQAVLYVGNHTSWIDILAMIAVQPCRHVAKSGVRGWPVIGPIATAAGTVWMDRDKLSTLPAAVERVARALRISGAVAGFPEGTTWCGRERGPFKPAISRRPYEPVPSSSRSPCSSPTVGRLLSATTRLSRRSGGRSASAGRGWSCWRSPHWTPPRSVPAAPSPTPPRPRSPVLCGNPRSVRPPPPPPASGPPCPLALRPWPDRRKVRNALLLAPRASNRA